MDNELEKQLRFEQIGSRARQFQAVIHGIGVFATGLAFIYDYQTHHILSSKVYSYIGVPTIIVLIWLALPVIGGITHSVGTLIGYWFLQIAGLAFIQLWYVLQIFIYIMASLHGLLLLLGPTILYSGVLFPITIIHIITVLRQRKVRRLG